MTPILLAGTVIDTSTLTAELGALVSAGATLVVCDVGALGPADLGAVDSLARLQLAARRLGCGLRLTHASRELQQLLGCVGLADVVLGVELLGVEVGRQAEDREQRVGVEEERELDDPIP
jgi:hypothetical protein